MFEGLVSALFQRLTAVLTLEDMMGVVMGKLIILCSLEKTADISPRHHQRKERRKSILDTCHY